MHATMLRDTVSAGTMYSTYDYAVLDWKLKLITCAMTTTIYLETMLTTMESVLIGGLQDMNTVQTLHKWQPNGEIHCRVECNVQNVTFVEKYVHECQC